MSVAKVTELSSSSTKSFEDAIQEGVARAHKTLDKVKGAWINEMKIASGITRINDRVFSITFIPYSRPSQVAVRPPTSHTSSGTARMGCSVSAASKRITCESLKNACVNTMKIRKGDIPANTSPETLRMVGEVVAELVYRGG